MNEGMERDVKSLVLEDFSKQKDGQRPVPEAAREKSRLPEIRLTVEPEKLPAAQETAGEKFAAAAADAEAVFRQFPELEPVSEPVPEPVPEPAEASPSPDPAAPDAPVPLPDGDILEQTASLWKYHPVPDTEPEPAPEYLRTEAEYPGGKIIAARVRGKKHKHEGTNCDDWYETACYEDVTFIAVSDGAGSKPFSRIGAKASCKAAAGYLTRAFPELLSGRPELRENLRQPMTEAKCAEACALLAQMVQRSVAKAYEAVEAAYYSRVTDPAFRAVLGRDLELKDLSGTLLVAVIVPTDAAANEHFIITCQVGDGMIAVINTAGPFEKSLKLMGEPDGGDFSGETDFLTSPKMRRMETLQARTKLSRGNFDLVMVMSDGVADDYFPNETELHKLYYDLAANGILTVGGPEIDLNHMDQRQVWLFRHMPDPAAYPWVNDQEVRIPLHYTDRICRDLSLTPEDIWRDPLVLRLAQKDMGERMRNASCGERLEIWLDNYVRRGSFDDRTLVVVKL